MNGDDLVDATVLVTGGAGFVGSHLVAALARDNDVRVLDRREPRLGDPAEGVRYVRGDVRDDAVLAEVLEGVDVVFHQAAIVSVERSVERPVRSHEVNATATLSLLERARRVGVRVVFASSAAVYGRPDAVPVAETDRKRPRSPYGIQKLAADRYARVYADHHGTETVPLRYFNVYGPGQSGGTYAGVVDVFVRRALAGDPLPIEGDGTQTRDFVFVEDVVDANLAAARTEAVGDAYNVGTGAETSIRELAELVREIAGADVDVIHREPRSGDVDRSRADLSAARRGIDFEPAVSLEAGLERTIEWYRAGRPAAPADGRTVD